MPHPDTFSHSEEAVTGDLSRAMPLAFEIGWRFAELYDRAELPPPRRDDPAAPPPHHLPGASEISDHDRAHLVLDQARVATSAVAEVLDIEPPSFDGISEVLDRPGHRRDDVRREILPVYVKVRDQIAAISPLAATSCGLGRLLADTALLPTVHHTEILLERFDEFRLNNAYRWLDDLSTSFPEHSSGAVKASLMAWSEWVTQTLQAQGSSSFTSLGVPVIRRLREQGEIWRRLIVGEVRPKGLLEPEDYVAAGGALMLRARQITWHYLKKWWLGVVIVLALTGGAVCLAVKYAPAGSTRAVAVLASLAGGLGVSWKSVGATLGRALSQAESSLWESEVVAAIGTAATVLPVSEGRRKQKDREPSAGTPNQVTLSAKS